MLGRGGGQRCYTTRLHSTLEDLGSSGSTIQPDQVIKQIREHGKERTAKKKYCCLGCNCLVVPLMQVSNWGLEVYEGEETDDENIKQVISKKEEEGNRKKRRTIWGCGYASFV